MEYYYTTDYELICICLQLEKGDKIKNLPYSKFGYVIEILKRLYVYIDYLFDEHDLIIFRID